MALLIVLFAGFGSLINVGAYYRDGWHTIPGLLAPAFFELYLPVMLARWVLTILLDLVLLRRGRWQMGTRLFDLALRLLELSLLIWMTSGPAVIDDAAFQSMLGGVEMPFQLSDMIRVALAWARSAQWSRSSKP